MLGCRVFCPLFGCQPGTRRNCFLRPRCLQHGMTDITCISPGNRHLLSCKTAAGKLLRFQFSLKKKITGSWQMWFFESLLFRWRHLIKTRAGLRIPQNRRRLRVFLRIFCPNIIDWRWHYSGGCRGRFRIATGFYLYCGRHNCWYR